MRRNSGIGTDHEDLLPITRQLISAPNGWRFNQSYEARKMAYKNVSKSQTVHRKEKLDEYLANKNLTSDTHLAPIFGNTNATKYYPRAPPNSPTKEPSEKLQDPLLCDIAPTRRTKSNTSNKASRQLIRKQFDGPTSHALLYPKTSHMNGQSILLNSSSSFTNLSSFLGAPNIQPRFPEPKYEVKGHFLRLAKESREEMEQKLVVERLLSRERIRRSSTEKIEPDFEIKGQGDELNGFNYIRRLSRDWERMGSEDSCSLGCGDFERYQIQVKERAVRKEKNDFKSTSLANSKRPHFPKAGPRK